MKGLHAPAPHLTMTSNNSKKYPQQRCNLLGTCRQPHNPDARSSNTLDWPRPHSCRCWGSTSCSNSANRNPSVQFPMPIPGTHPNFGCCRVLRASMLRGLRLKRGASASGGGCRGHRGGEEGRGGRGSAAHFPGRRPFGWTWVKTNGTIWARCTHFSLF